MTGTLAQPTPPWPGPARMVAALPRLARSLAADRHRGPDPLRPLGLTKAALTGSVSSETNSYRTKRHQELVVLTLIACHIAGKPAPVGLLDELARITGSRIAPRPNSCSKPSKTNSNAAPYRTLTQQDERCCQASTGS